MGVYWLIEGVFDVILALVHRAPHWGWRLAGGIISALAGLVILAYPIAGTVFTVLFLFWVLVIGAIISGILVSERDGVLSTLETLGFELREEIADGDWWSAELAPC